MNELSVAEKNALSVSYEVDGEQINIDMDFVKKYLVSGDAKVTDKEVMFFLQTCKMQKLNPLVSGNVYLIKYGEKKPAQLVVGKAAYMKRAFANPSYLRKEDGIVVERKNGDIVKKEGCCVYPSEKLLGGWCKVYYWRHNSEQSSYKEVALADFNQGRNNWGTMPAIMINKVAISQCVRDAFPEEFSGLYADDEMVASGAVPPFTADGKIIVETPAKTQKAIGGESAPVEEVVANSKADVKITQAQRRELFGKAKAKLGDIFEDVMREFVNAEGITSTTDMTNAMYDRIMAKIDTYEVEVPPESGVVEAEVVSEEEVAQLRKEV